MRQTAGSRRTCLGTTQASTSVPKLQQQWNAWIRVRWGRQEEWAEASSGRDGTTHPNCAEVVAPGHISKLRPMPSPREVGFQVVSGAAGAQTLQR